MFLKRLLIGMVLGAILGAVVAAILVQGLGLAVTTGSTAVVAYLAAGATGLVTGLVTGKPIWAAEGKIEAGLKAFFGMLLALGGLFALRSWVHVPLDLQALKAGTGEIGWLPAAYLPVLSAVLGGFFELDNNTSEEKDKKEGEGAKVRVAAKSEDEALAEDEALEDEPAAKKRR